jgi:type I restriction enzyme M protein
LGDSDGTAPVIRQKLIEQDRVEAIIVLPRELFITTDISVTMWILNMNKKGGSYHGRKLRNREKEILFMDLRQWTDNPVKGEQYKKVQLSAEQIAHAAQIYHTWQSEGTDGQTYAVPELYRSVDFEELEKNNFSLVPSRYIEFADRDQNIDYEKIMSDTSRLAADILARQQANHAALKKAFAALGYPLEVGK